MTSGIAVLGAGAWGTALARLLAEKGRGVRLWAQTDEHARALAEARENVRYLPGAPLPDGVQPTADLAEALYGAGLVLFVVPSHALREVARRACPGLSGGALLVSATKGIEVGSLALMSEVLKEELGDGVSSRLTCLSGPSFAREVARHQPTAVVVAGEDARVTETVQHELATERFRVYASDDLVGVQLGGAIKNVIAIAAGASDGFGFGHNARAALITRGLAEIGRLAAKRGAHPLTLAGLSGLGDLVLTCTGELSRNRTVGYELARGRSLADVLATLGHVAEGVATARSAHALAHALGVEMPITREVFEALHLGKDPHLAVSRLMMRELTRE